MPHDTDWPLHASALRFFDLETTGLRPDRGARITEAAVLDHQTTCLYWQRTANRPVAAPLDRLLRCFADAVVVGHNLAFDFRFLTYEAERQHQASFTLRYIDTLSLARAARLDAQLGLPDLALETLARRLVGREEASGWTFHTARGDAVATRAVLWALANRLNIETLADAGLQRMAWAP